MAQAWQVVPGLGWEGIAGNEKGKSWKGGAESGESWCQVMVGEALRNRGLGGQSEGVRDKNRGSERKHGRSGVGSVMVRNQKQVGRVTRGERGQQVS